VHQCAAAAAALTSHQLACCQAQSGTHTLATSQQRVPENTAVHTATRHRQQRRWQQQQQQQAVEATGKRSVTFCVHVKVQHRAMSKGQLGKLQAASTVEQRWLAASLYGELCGNNKKNQCNNWLTHAKCSQALC
jgi:hypothetical protein